MKIALAFVVCAVVALVNTQEFDNMKVVKLPLDMLTHDQRPQARAELQMQPDQFQRRGGKGNDSPPPQPQGWGWGPPPMMHGGWGAPMMGWGGGPPAYGR